VLGPVGTAKKLRGAFFFFLPLLGGIMGGKEDMEARASRAAQVCGWLGRGVLGGSPEA
jgi:hypothetical protein